MEKRGDFVRVLVNLFLTCTIKDARLLRDRFTINHFELLLYDLNIEHLELIHSRIICCLPWTGHLCVIYPGRQLAALLLHSLLMGTKIFTDCLMWQI